METSRSKTVLTLRYVLDWILNRKDYSSQLLQVEVYFIAAVLSFIKELNSMLNSYTVLLLTFRPTGFLVVSSGSPYLLSLLQTVSWLYLRNQSQGTGTFEHVMDSDFDWCWFSMQKYAQMSTLMVTTPDGV